MSKDEAIQAMREGKKITHRWFTDNEWMTMEGRKIVLEDGVRCDPYEFWNARFQDGWKDGYEIKEVAIEKL